MGYSDTLEMINKLEKLGTFRQGNDNNNFGFIREILYRDMRGNFTLVGYAWGVGTFDLLFGEVTQDGGFRFGKRVYELNAAEAAEWLRLNVEYDDYTGLTPGDVFPEGIPDPVGIRSREQIPEQWDRDSYFDGLLKWDGKNVYEIYDTIRFILHHGTESDINYLEGLRTDLNHGQLSRGFIQKNSIYAVDLQGGYVADEDNRVVIGPWGY